MTARRPALTGAATIPLLAPFALIGLAWVSGSPWLFLPAIGTWLLLAVTWLDRPRVDDVEYQADGPDRVAVGQPVVLSFRARNSGSRRTTAFTARCVVDERVVAAADYFVPALAPGATATAAVQRTALHRGASPVEVVVVARSTLGFSRSVGAPHFYGFLVVHPAPVAPARLRTLCEPGDEAIDPSRGAGLEPAGIREWRPGDDVRRVHWRATARHGDLVVVERGRGDAPALLAVVVGPSTAGDWEDVVAVAASTTRRALRTAPVSLVNLQVPDHDLTGLRAEVDLLDWWALLGDVDLPAADRVVAAVVARGSREVLVVASSAAPAAWWHELEAASSRAGVRVWTLGGPV